ncbi:MAG: YncE family protein [Deltaproteobacteria bacterium]|nr:YncE family protein [Deltaproteobacteria bacterium]
MLPRTLLSPLAAFLLLASCLVGCGEERVVYDRLDASAWGSGCTDPGIPDGGLGYVTNSLMNSVAVLDLGAGTVRATHPIGVGPLAENGPHHLAVDLARSVLYSPLSFPAAAIPAGPHAEHGSSDTPGIFVKRSLCDFRLLGQVDVDPNPGDMVLSADGRTAYVSHFDLRRAQANVGDPERQKSNLIVIDTATMTRTATIPVCVAAHGMVVSSDGRTVFMACYGDDALGVVSLDGPRPTVRLVHIGGSPPRSTTSPSYGPYSLALSPDGASVWLGCAVANVLIAYDVASGTLDESRLTRRLPGKAWFPGFSPDGSTMVVPTQGRDSVTRLSTGPGLALRDQRYFTPEECTLPHQVAYGPDGLYYLVCEGRHTSDPARSQPGSILALHPDDLRTVRSFPVGVFPDAIVFAGGGSR